MPPKTEWICEDVPELRIVDQVLWDQVQAQLASIRAERGADDPGRPHFWEYRCSRRVLTGQVFCGCCGSPMAAVGQDYLACNRARRQGLCDLEGQVLEALRERLMAPALVAEFMNEFTADAAENGHK
jgi:hypothetical protein